MIPLTPSVAVRILLWATLLTGGAAAGFTLDRLWFGHWLGGFLWHAVTLPAGLLLLFLVMRVSRNTGRTLARLGREGELPRPKTNRLVTAGPYACMRHLMHLGLLLFPEAFGLTLGSPAFILLIAPAAMMRMLHLEGGTGFKSRLAALGVTVGASLEILQNRGQGPVLALIRGSRIAIGRGEARKILVKGPENAKQGTS